MWLQTVKNVSLNSRRIITGITPQAQLYHLRGIGGLRASLSPPADLAARHVFPAEKGVFPLEIRFLSDSRPDLRAVQAFREDMGALG